MMTSKIFDGLKIFSSSFYQLIAATTTLGVARIISACLPVRCDSSNRVLPTPGDAIHSNGLPPRPTSGQYRPRSPHCRLPTEQSALPTPPSPPPLPLSLRLPQIGQWQEPQTERSRRPLGDPSARVLETFLTTNNFRWGNLTCPGGDCNSQSAFPGTFRRAVIYPRCKRDRFGIKAVVAAACGLLAL
jgi:hypothetical protein